MSTAGATKWRCKQVAVWRELEADAAAVEALAAAGHPRLLARLLALRGQDAASAAEYLKPELSRRAPTRELPGVAEAAQWIAGHLGDIVVYGDYDCDGVSATAILTSAINSIRPGAAAAFIPDRLSEGYGMSGSAVARMLDEHPDVKTVITVDNGIGALEHVRMLKARGVASIVTDHHLPGPDAEELCRTAVAVINPKLGAPERLADLCGAGVAFMLAEELVATARSRGIYAGPPIGGPLLVMAGLATVTDIVPLRGQNRIFVAEALKRFRKTAPAGLKELYDRARRHSEARMTAVDFGFLIGPRVNAAGRMASSMTALELMLETDREKARELAYAVDSYNTERKQCETAMTERALAQIEPGAPAQVIHLPDGHQGVAGIVASRVLEQHPAGPVAVVVGEHGSCRAPAGFNVYDALEASASVLERFGGHAQAGGFSVKAGKIGEFRRLFRERSAWQAEQMRRSGVEPDTVFYDAEVDGRELSVEAVESLAMLEPYGEGNLEPLFRMRNVRIARIRSLGMSGRHLALEFADCGIKRGVWWNCADAMDRIAACREKPVEMLFHAGLSDYGQRHVEIKIVDLRAQP